MTAFPSEATVRSDRDGSRPPTIVSIFRQQVIEQAHRSALRFFDAGWQSLNWHDYGIAVDEVAAGLIEAAVAAGDHVALLASNRPEWHVADLAILTVGAITVPVYPTSSSSQVAYVLADASVKACVVDNSEQLAKVLLHREELPSLETIVVIDEIPGLDTTSRNNGWRVTDLGRIRKTGRQLLAENRNMLDGRMEGVSPDNIATLVYTSGTTGPPKGTVLTHGNIVWTIEAVASVTGLSAADRFLSYLPLSHIAERVVSHFGQVFAGGETWFAKSLASVPDDLKACRPTIFFAVPRVWQKFQDAINDQLSEQPAPVRKLLGRYLDAGARALQADERNERLPMRDRVEHRILDATLGRRLRAQVGLDQARMLVSSAAPIHPDLVRWFHAIGLPIAEAWGQTEDSGPATLNPPGAIRIGSVGLPLPGLEVRSAPDGELLVRGGSVCAGYHGRPNDTAELIDADGWMTTGDLGTIDAAGYVTITGRKKDLIINAAGKNISPAEIEARLGMEPLIGQAVVVGDGRRYLVALLTLDPDEAADWARERGSFAGIDALINDPSVRAEIEAAVGRVNQQHARVEQIKRWRLLPKVLSVHDGELTPTLKVKRSLIAETYASLIDEMYAENADA